RRVVVARTTLKNGRGVMLDRSLEEAEFEAEALERYGMIYHSGAGLLCTDPYADILRRAADPDWLALDPVPYTIDPG
ncbi:MAG TPA: hypothetical protein VMZ71_07585, partial [Gemmataceae bacterium]|nr:hypothetical protein [Gemmataceae bacterium]